MSRHDIVSLPIILYRAVGEQVSRGTVRARSTTGPGIALRDEIERQNAFLSLILQCDTSRSLHTVAVLKLYLCARRLLRDIEHSGALA